MTADAPRPPARRRRWWFRWVALLLPLICLGLLEISFRLVGVAEEDPWANHHVRFVSGERYFPSWDDDVEMPKPAGTARIFVFGGSSVIARGTKPFPLCLEEELPDRRFEVVNAGVVAFGTLRVFEVMKEAAAYDPDLFVVYTGHNEFLEKIFFDPDGFLARQERFSETVSRFRVIRWVRGLLSDRPLDVPRPAVQRHFLGSRNFPLIDDLDQYRLGLEFTRSNVTQMCRFAADRDIPILVLPAVPNYLWSPGDPVHGPGYESAPDRWQESFDRGMEAWKAGRPGEAAEAFGQAAAIDGDHALLVHYLGLTALELGRTEEGIRQLVRAVDLDRRGDRANSDVRARIFEAVAAVKGERPGRVVESFDLRPRLLEFVPRDFEAYRSDTGPTIFIDHCHLSAEGHRLVGALIAERIRPILAREDG